MRKPGLVKITAAWDTLRTSYWFVPTVMALASVILYAVVHLLDQELEEQYIYSLDWIFTGGPEGAREVLSVIAASMITIAGVTFSITIVALTLASQQFGPFLLRNFMRDTGNQVVLGTFISTFIFCLLTLRTIRGTDRTTFVPHFSITVAILLAMCSLGVLIYFIHHVSVFIQASNTISVVGLDLEQAIDRLFPKLVGRATNEMESRGRVPEASDPGVVSIHASGHGYIKAVDGDQLLAMASKHGLVVRILKRAGDFTGQGDEIALVYPGESVNDAVKEAVNESLMLGAQRTATQDVEFVFSQLVEVAVRSLSPGINDPFTAIVCIDHLGQGLRRMAGREIPSPFRHADDGALRVVAYPVSFADMADTAFNQIRHYGRSSATVLNRLLLTIAAIAPHVGREEDRQALRRHANLIIDVGVRGLEEDEARVELGKRFAEVLIALERKDRPAGLA